MNYAAKAKLAAMRKTLKSYFYCFETDYKIRSLKKASPPQKKEIMWKRGTFFLISFRKFKIYVSSYEHSVFFPGFRLFFCLLFNKRIDFALHEKAFSFFAFSSSIQPTTSAAVRGTEKVHHIQTYFLSLFSISGSFPAVEKISSKWHEGNQTLMLLL